MTYELERMQKLRRETFERQMQDLDSYLRFMNLAHAYVHHPELLQSHPAMFHKPLGDIHSQQTKPDRVKSDNSRRETLNGSTARFGGTKPADIHNPSQGSHREGTNYTRVEVGRENSAFEGTVITLQTQPSSEQGDYVCVCKSAGLNNHLPSFEEWVHEDTREIK